MSARVRLTIVYTALYLVAGAVLVAIVYGLVASSLTNARTVKVPDKQLLAQCTAAFKSQTASPDFQTKCKAALNAAAGIGASAQRDRTLRHLLEYALLGLAGTTLLAALLGWIVAGRILRPVHAITAAARRASEQHLGERLALQGPRDELRELADTFDEMLDRLDAAFASQQRFVANASHELRTPLTVMHTAIDVALAKPDPTVEQLTATAASVRATLADAERLIDALLTLARSEQQPAAREPVDLSVCVEDALDDASARIAERGLLVDSMLQPASTIGDRVLLERCVANLVDNAIRYNVAGGTIRIATRVDDGQAVLTIANDGQVVPRERVAELFEPFQRLDARTQHDGGVGLGLSIVRAVTDAHDGRVDAGALDAGGLEITVRLPKETDAPAPVS